MNQQDIGRGQWMGFIVCLAAIGGSVFCAYIDQPWVAGIISGTFLGGVVTAFLRR